MKTFKLLNKPRWLLLFVDRLGVTQGEINLTEQKVEQLIKLINEASDKGAPWGRYKKKRGFEYDG